MFTLRAVHGGVKLGTCRLRVDLRRRLRVGCHGGRCIVGGRSRGVTKAFRGGGYAQVIVELRKHCVSHRVGYTCPPTCTAAVVHFSYGTAEPRFKVRARAVKR
eukprot:1058485-Prorocentrum_minimum.AAC.2